MDRYVFVKRSSSRGHGLRTRGDCCDGSSGCGGSRMSEVLESMRLYCSSALLMLWKMEVMAWRVRRWFLISSILS